MSRDGCLLQEIPRRQLFRWLASLVLLSAHMRNPVKKILIVDEDDACRESLGMSIKGLGYEVFEATTGPEALDTAYSRHPDVMMLDLPSQVSNGVKGTES